MGTKNLFNYLKLAYTPVSNYDFVTIQDSPQLCTYMNSGKIYMIVQRPVLSFENLTVDNLNIRNPNITFQIRQRGNENVIKASMPMYQESFGASHTTTNMEFRIEYTYPKPKNHSANLPFYQVANFIFKPEGGDYVWFSPEKFLYHYLRESIEARVEGKIEDFLKYKLHYIGKATEQDIVKRLTGHSHLQEILSLEHPINYGSLPTDEIVLLFFNFDNNIHMRSFEEDDDIRVAVNMVKGINPIDQRTIYLDAEKAFINALKPNYNKQLYNQYPKSKDGLFSHDLDVYTYNIIDPITLIYDGGEIRGNSESYRGDWIVVKKGKPAEIK
ncbi:hypothetical protein KHS38_06010 [Mucilaginibacter sp. Bleaf8]|uniref:hypothetical protein n=1 Tax=Mucilaginibacter sp. Bleaf8 TaxID=2834430 RepID=UPI001BD1A88F|nr:hypothetical protein [Mucilaginibacter sp. Bleaf8]MBS7563954.1 hypothetical protein [Mucilaginibacter sp. Bleaf8]